MDSFVINGGKRLTGEIQIHGSKNSVLPILAASFLVNGRSVIHNCPLLSDVDAALKILIHLGCKVERDGHTVTVESLDEGNAFLSYFSRSDTRQNGRGKAFGAGRL